MMITKPLSDGETLHFFPDHGDFHTNHSDWRGECTLRLTSLSSEIDRLQSNRTFQFSNYVTGRKMSIKNEMSFATMQNDGCGGCLNFINLVKRRRVAGLQCLWLLTCLAVFLYFGIDEMERAGKNVNAKYKPLSMTNVIDYGVPSENQYTVPDIMFRVNVEPPEDVTDSEAIELLEAMFGQEGQTSIHDERPFDVYCFYESDMANFDIYDRSGWFGMEELHYNISRILKLGNSAYAFVAGLHIKIEDPVSTKGQWMCALLIRRSPVSLNDTVVINYIQIAIDRETPAVSMDTLQWKQIHKIDLEETNYFTYSYSEEEHKLSDGTMRYIFEDKLTRNEETWFKDFKDFGDIVTINIVPDLRVETWEEYIEYSYTDWIFAMGGMVSWASIFFFWGAYYIHKFVDSGSQTLGILPIMSFRFANTEEVQVMKYQLKTLGILTNQYARRSSHIIPVLPRTPKCFCIC